MCAVALLLGFLPAAAAGQAAGQAVGSAGGGDEPIIAALRRGSNQEALEATRSALLRRPGDCRLLSLQGLAYTGLGQAEAALASFREALGRCPAYLPALEGAAQIEYGRHDPAAVGTLGRILAAEPENVPAHAMLASTLAEAGKCTESLSHFVAARAAFPSRPEFQQRYAACLAETGDSRAALGQYKELAARQPTDASVYNVAVLEWKLRELDQAMATLAPLLAAGHFEPAFALGAKISEERGDTPRAVELLRKAIGLVPDDPDNYVAFGGLAFDHASFAAGVEMLNAGLKRLPDAAALYLARGVLEVQMSRTEAALADFDRAHRLDNTLSFAMDAMGLLDTQQHRDGAALRRFEELAKVHPDDAFLQYLLAEQIAGSNREARGAEQGAGQGAGRSADLGTDLERAVAAAKRSTVLDPKYLPAQDLLILLYMRSGKPELAIEQAERTLAQDPNNESALYQELQARRRMGQKTALPGLTARLQAARKENALKQQKVDRYRLQGQGGEGDGGAGRR